MLSFGISWGVSWGVVGLGSTQGDMVAPDWAILVGGLVGSLLVGLYVLMARRFDSLRFGLFIRLALALSGLVCVCIPCASVLLPAAVPVLCRAVVLVQGVAMTFFSVEICHEKRLGIVEVMPLNYIVFVVSGCLAMALPMVLNAHGVTGLLYWSLLSAVSVGATILVIPTLPSSTSTAATFTFSELPENESYETRALHAMVNLASKHGLSARETEVLELLVQGKNRTEIAERLALSSWTVKDHLTSIYRKVGVHSAKELMVLVAGGETAGRG